jgi:tetratricopeptide (TPR) repeat protein
MINIFTVKPQRDEIMVSRERLLADIAAAMRAGNSTLAARLADAALAEGMEHPLPYQARALHLDKAGKSEEALANFRKAHDLGPDDPMTANGVAICLGRMGRLAESMDAFRIALALDPGHATTCFHMGWILEMHGQFGPACDAYKEAVTRAPDYAAAWAGLATAAQANQDWKLTRIAAERALALDARQPRTILSLAIAEVREAQFAVAEARLRRALDAPGLVPPALKTVMLGILADALDGQDRAAEAFAFYTAENRERLASLPSPPQFDVLKLVRDLAGHVERTDPGVWTAQASADADGARAHVFLLGFPRSGTTLLEQVLAAHPDVATLEESDVLDPIADEFLHDDASFARFVSRDDISPLRAGYWRRVRAHGLDVSGKAFVDKLPLNTIKLPLIARLFPDAKILFAVRDPRDVVFSCFRRHFQINASTYPFLTLEGAARFYDAVMSLAEISRARLPLQVHLHRHEDLVRDFEGQMRGLCTFMGLPWSARFGDFAQGAQRRSIRSISAAQVRQGLNGRGRGQWRRYADDLKPVLPILQPWVARFGYQED